MVTWFVFDPHMLVHLSYSESWLLVQSTPAMNLQVLEQVVICPCSVISGGHGLFHVATGCTGYFPLQQA